MPTKSLSFRNLLRLCLFVINCSLFCLFCSAQSETNNFTTYDTILVDGQFQWNARISRPVHMFTPNHADTASRPVIISMPGAGEYGTDMSKLQLYGPHYWKNNGWNGSVVLGNGTHYPILITVMKRTYNGSAWNTEPRGPQIHNMMNILFNKFHIKRNSVHVAGLSQGGFAWGKYIVYEASAGARTGMRNIKSYTALQGVSNIAHAPYDAWDLGWNAFGTWAQEFGGKFFGLEGTSDTRQVWQVSENMNAAVPGSAYFSWENYGGGAHCCWNTFYSPFINDWKCTAPITNANLVVNATHANTMGTYFKGSNLFQWMLRQGDSSLVGSTAPTANAGTDQSIILPVSSATLNGTGSTGTITTYSWTNISGPTTPGINNSATATATAIDLVEGTYVFRLTVGDGVTTSSDDISVQVLPAPVADAGSDQTITLPVSSATLNGTGSTGTITTYSWTYISGPATPVINNNTSATATATGLQQGTYVFRLTVGNGATTSSDDMAVEVLTALVANAGTDQSITLPVSSATLNGTASTGTITSYSWTNISGPTTAVINNHTTATATAIDLEVGTYIFRLTVGDGIATHTDDVSVVVLPNGPSEETHDFITYDSTLVDGQFQWSVRISRPLNMFTPNHADTASRPVIISMPGAGEYGTDMSKLQLYGPHYWMNNGWDGSVELGNGKHYPILITVMRRTYNGNPWNTEPRGPQIHNMMNILFNRFHIKRNSVHVAGLSQGGFAWGKYIVYEASAGARTGMRNITSYTGLQGISNLSHPPYDAWSLGWNAFGTWALEFGGKFFGLEGTSDTKQVWQVSENMNATVPGSAYFSWENYGGGAHCCWNTFYSPFIYDWKCTAPITNANLVVNATHANTMGTYFKGSNLFQWMLRQGDSSLVGNFSARIGGGRPGKPITNLVEVPADNSQQAVIYPNPSGNEVTLSIFNSSAGPVTIKILNTAGVPVQMYEFKNQGMLFNKVLHTTKLAKGIYFIKIVTTGNTVVRRFVKM